MPEFRLLGPVEVQSRAGPVDGGPPQQRVVLAVLLVDAGRPVRVETLIDRVWDERPPPGARRALHAHISRIRHMLREAGTGGPSTPGAATVSVVRRSGGYEITADADLVDWHRFRRLIEAARVHSASDAERTSLLRDALRMWQGTPLADLPGTWAARTREAWLQQRLDAAVTWAEAELRLGRHGEVIGSVRDLLVEYPLAEPLVTALLRALAAAGRGAEALDYYAIVRARLAEELGSEPGLELRELHRAILRGEGGPPRGASPGRPEPRPRIPAQLPPDVRGFAGRADELARLDAILATMGTEPTAVVVSAVSGTAGVGKTALAIHWAHRNRHRFPDGQLYVDLRGYHPAQPMDAGEALAGFLTALGVNGSDLPFDDAGRAARYRTEISGRRVLIVLDNAANVEQIRPLLPGTPSCVVVVTSRDSLPGLVARDGAHRIVLDLLPAAEAVSLLRLLVGDRIDAEPAAAAGLADRCARLPLALRVAAELAAARPSVSLAELVADLADQQQPLDLLDAGGDPFAGVTAVFSWSMRHLPPHVARLFRLLGLHPGPDFDDYAAAALTDTSLGEARRSLDTLARAHLVHATGRDRYGMHDLLRAYAHDLTIGEAADERRPAMARMFDYYLAAAAEAMNTMYPAEAERRPHIDPPGTPVPDLHDLDTARTWIEAEQRGLVAVAAYTASHGWPGHTVQLSIILHRFLDGSGAYADAMAVHVHARDAARLAADPAGEARALLGIGDALWRLGRSEPAAEQLQQALKLLWHTGDQHGEARALGKLGYVEQRLGRYPSAAEHQRRALEVYRRLGDVLGEAGTLTNLGVVESLSGNHTAAARHHRQALALFRVVGDQHGEAVALDNLGTTELRLGHFKAAAGHQEAALALFRQAGNRVGEAWTMDSLGALQIRLRRWSNAAEYYRRALTIFREIGERDGQASVLNGLGEAAHASGRTADAIIEHTAALDIARETGARNQQARAHAGLGHAHEGGGNSAHAREHYRHALRLYRELHMPEADDIRTHLATQSATPTN